MAQPLDIVILSIVLGTLYLTFDACLHRLTMRSVLLSYSLVDLRPDDAAENICLSWLSVGLLFGAHEHSCYARPGKDRRPYGLTSSRQSVRGGSFRFTTVRGPVMTSRW